MAEPKNILFISSISTQFKALLPLVDIVKKNKEFNPVFYFDTSIWSVSEEIEQCNARKIDFIIDKKRALDSTVFSLSYKRSEYVRPFFYKIMWRLLFHLRNAHPFFTYLSVFYNDILNAQKVLLENNIQCVIVAEDANYIVPFFVKVASNNNIKTIVFPFSFCNQEEYVFALKGKKVYSLNSFSKRVFTFIFPKWKYKANNQTLIRKPVSEALAMEILGCAPENPWIYIGGNSSVIFVESEFTKDYYVRSGINKEKIKIIGRIAFEQPDTQGLEGSKEGVYEKTVLCSLPPDMKDYKMFSSHRDMVEYWIKSLKKPGVKLIVSLHPRLAYNDFSFIENEYGVQIAMKSVGELIKECDIFVACISATIRTALVYNKIILNFDMFNMDYSDYNHIPMVITVTAKEDFLKQYAALINGDDYINDLKKYYGNYSKEYFGFTNPDIVQDISLLISNKSV